MTRMLRSAALALALWSSSSCGPAAEPEVSAASLQPLPEAAFAGRTADPNLFAAVVTGADGVEVYLCDDVRDLWFHGTASPGEVVTLTSGDAQLVLSLEADRVVGELIEGTTRTALTLPAVQQQVLFRDDQDVGEVRVVGGWIRLPDGEQRGLVRVADTSVSSRLVDGIVTCAACEALALQPAPFTPSVAQRRANTLARFTVLGLGDSYMAGEGAPVVEGNHQGSGSVVSEQWSDGLAEGYGSFTFTYQAGEQTRLTREAKACHRGASGLGVAVSALTRKWPVVQFLHQNLACSGATVANLTTANDSGPAGCGSLSGSAATECLAAADDVPSNSIAPQLPSGLAFFRRQGVSVDAVAMSIGGNDLGFGDVIADCLSSPGSGCEASNSPARQAVASGTAALPGRYAALSSALVSAGVARSNVLLTQHLNPLRRNASDLCSGLEFNDALLRFLSDEESVFAGSVHRTLNDLVRTAATAHSWKLVSSHVGTETTHGMCTSDPWFNDTTAALDIQGADLPSPSLGVNISAGMVHPNKDGQRLGYAPAWEAALDGVLRTRFTPRTPTRFRVVGMRLEGGRGVVTLRWDDVNTFEREHVLRGSAGAPSTTTTGADSTEATVLLDGTSGTFTLEACFTGGPARLCSPRSGFLDVEVKRPDFVPLSPRAQRIVGEVSILSLTWNDAAPSRMWTTVELDIGGVISSRATDAQSLGLVVTTDLRRFRVAACNDLGCGPATAWVSVAP